MVVREAGASLSKFVRQIAFQPDFKVPEPLFLQHALSRRHKCAPLQWTFH